MPLGAGGSLPSKDYVDVVAFLLDANGQKAGAEALTGDEATLGRMALAASSPASADPTRQLPAPEQVPAASGAVASAELGPSQAELLAAPGNGSDWLTSNRDYGGQRYSPLTQIDRANVARLREACSFTPNYAAKFQTFPVVHDGIMYFTSALSTLAIDAATCAPRWRHDWPTSLPGVETAANRGVAIADGRVLRGTADGYLLALSARDGNETQLQHVVDCCEASDQTQSERARATHVHFSATPRMLAFACVTHSCDSVAYVAIPISASCANLLVTRSRRPLSDVNDSSSGASRTASASVEASSPRAPLLPRSA